MTVDIFAVSDQSQRHLLFQLDAADLKALKPALAELQAKTGVFLDPYGTTRLHLAHCRLLASLIRKPPTRDRRVEPFASFLEACEHDAIIFIGD